MTLTVCLKGSNGMVLACDSRGTFGDPRGTTAQNDNMVKLYKLSEYVGVLFAGSAEFAATLIQDIRENQDADPTSGITPIMNQIREVVIRKYTEWFPGFLPHPIQGRPAPIKPGLAITVGGYELNEDNIPNIQKIYSLNSANNFAPAYHDYGYALNGVAQYALYLLNRLYVPDMTVDCLTHLGAYVISETASQDGKVGGPVRIITISPEDGCLQLDPQHINDILSTNEARTEDLKTLFRS